MSQNFESVKKFFNNFLKLKEISNLSHIQNSTTRVRQIRVKDIQYLINNDNIESMSLKINNHLASFIKNHISSINKVKVNKDCFKDQNELYLGISFFKISFPEKDADYYIPILMYDLTDQKPKIFEDAFKTGVCSLNVSLIKNLKINKEVIKVFFNFDSSFNGVEIDEVFSDNLCEFVPLKYQENIYSFINYINSFFEKHLKEEFKDRVVFPKPTKESDVILMFFNTVKDIKINQEIDLAFNEKNELLNEYIEYISQEKDVEEARILNPDLIWTGALTKQYPLGRGQSIVMQLNQKNKRIIPVIGGPGTGKTTLFLSIIAQEITKRTLAIIDGRDYNNLMLATSTSNKAVSNIYDNLKKGFQKGFVFVGGNSSNKTESKKEVEEFIEYFKMKEYDVKKMNQYKKNIQNILNFFEKKKKEFFSIQKFVKETLKVNSVYELKKLRNQIESKTLVISDDEYNKRMKIIIENIKKINYILNKKYSISDIRDFIKKDSISKLEIAIKKMEKINFFKKVFKGYEEIIKTLDLPFDVNTKEDIEIVLEYLKIIEAQDIDLIQDIYSNKIFLKQIEEILSSNKEKSLDRILKANSYAEYFRVNFYTLNYRLYIQSLKFNEQYALLNKDKVLKALGYLKAENEFEYIKEHYGFRADKVNEMFKWISLMYPVVTSTLVSIPQMFKGVYPNNVLAYNLVLADEAGMIDAIGIIPALRRANRAIIVGDPKQLPPIVNLEDVFSDIIRDSVNPIFYERYNPLKVSAYHRAAGTLEGGYQEIGKGVILDEHRRCAPKIAKLFFDIADYKGLKICTHKPNSKPFNVIKEELFFFDVKSDKNTKKGKVNKAEIKTIEVLLKRLHKAGYDLTKDVGIITPYKNQEQELIKSFQGILNHSLSQPKIGTVHKFQGAEYKVIIFSCVVDKNDSLEFINKDPSLINVAISRAKEVFFAIGNYDAITKNKSNENFVGKMATLIKERGLFVPVSPK